MTDPKIAAREILGDCRCHEAYKGRGLQDPSCLYCEFHFEVEDALIDARVSERTTAYKAGMKDALEPAIKEADRYIRASHCQYCGDSVATHIYKFLVRFLDTEANKEIK